LALVVAQHFHFGTLVMPVKNRGVHSITHCATLFLGSSARAGTVGDFLCPRQGQYCCAPPPRFDENPDCLACSVVNRHAGQRDARQLNLFGSVVRNSDHQLIRSVFRLTCIPSDSRCPSC
jgi:hypothetical protein